MQRLLLIALGGATGTLARYGVSTLAQRLLGGGFPWGTAAVNLLGAFVAGLIWAAAETRAGLSVEARSILLIGFLGAFTTFSALMLDTTVLAQQAGWLRATGNLLLHNVAGMVLMVLGLALGRSL